MDEFLENRVRSFLLEDSMSEEEFGGDKEYDKEMVVNQSKHDSESEISEDDIDFNDDCERDESNDFFCGKDKNTKWYNNPCVSKFTKTQKHNVLKTILGPEDDANLIQSKLDAFYLLISDIMIEEIAHCTNIQIESVQLNYSRSRDAKFLTKIKLSAFFGLLYLSGLKKSKHMHFSELWATDKSGIQIF